MKKIIIGLMIMGTITIVGCGSTIDPETQALLDHYEESLQKENIVEEKNKEDEIVEAEEVIEEKQLVIEYVDLTLDNFYDYFEYYAVVRNEDEHNAFGELTEEKTVYRAYYKVKDEYVEKCRYVGSDGEIAVEYEYDVLEPWSVEVVDNNIVFKNKDGSITNESYHETYLHEHISINSFEYAEPYSFPVSYFQNEFEYEFDDYKQYACINHKILRATGRLMFRYER